MAQTNFGTLLQLYRGVNRIGVRTLAKEIGLGHATLNRIERGYSMDLETFLKLQTWLLKARAE